MPRAQLFIDNGGYSVKALYLPASADRSDSSGSNVDTHASGIKGSATRGEAAVAPTPGPAPKVLVIPNCVGAAEYAGTGIMGDQLDRLPHYHGLLVRRPVDRGFIVDGGLQARVWEHVLQHFSIESEEDVDVWLTVPFAAPKAVAQLIWLLCTRSFRFGSVTLVSSTFMSLVAYAFARCISSPSNVIRKRPRSTMDPNAHMLHDCSVLNVAGGGVAVMVDVGFSSTTVVPYVDYLPVRSSIVRLDVGGKLLTNRLKEYISFSQMNVMQDTWLINHIKERCCIVALDPRRSLQRCETRWRGKTRQEVEAALTSIATVLKKDGDPDAMPSTSLDVPLRYYLPTIPALFPLGVLEAELSSRLPKTSGVDAAALQHLLLCQERFLIPELLFTPGDVGINQQGIAQIVTEGIFQRGLLQHLTTGLRPMLLRHVCVFGGTAAQMNFLHRLAAEVAAVVPLPPLDDTDENSTGMKHVNKHNVTGQHNCAETGAECTTCLPVAPPLPSFLLPAVRTASELSLQPLLGAWCFFSTESDNKSDDTPMTGTQSSSCASRRELLQLRTIVQQRSRIELQHPSGGRVTVETFQHALENML